MIPKHKIFFRKEFFGSIIYNTKDKNYYFFDRNSTSIIKKVFENKGKNNPELIDSKKELIDNGLFTSNISFFDYKTKGGFSAPLRVFIDITHKCNLRCKHCFTDSGKLNPNELTTEDIIRLIDQMKASGSFLLSIAGGEPLLRDDLFKVIKYARDNYIDVSITLNGLLIDERSAKKLNSLGLRTITISIDGLEKNHDYIRGKGNFKKAIKGLKLLKQLCKTAKVSMKCTVNSLNINDYEGLIGLAEKLRLDSIKFNPIRLFGRTINNRYLLITQKDYITFLNNVQKVKTNLKVTIPKTPLDKRKYEFIKIGFGCTGGKETCNISPSGDFSPCSFLGNEYVVGNIKNEPFLSLWEKAKKGADFCGNKTCVTCSEYNNCRGGCRNRALFEYNNINAIDPLCTLKKISSGKITIKKEREDLTIYDHSVKNYKKFKNIKEIEGAYPEFIKNKQYRIIKNSIKAPLKIFFDITNKCNSKCIHCFNSSGQKTKEEITLATIKNLAKEMNGLGIYQVSLSGGEPFVRKDIFEIIKLFNENDIDVSVTSNGLMLGKENIKLLDGVKIKSLTISIDGINADKYKEIRGIDGFDKINENLILLRKNFSGELAMRFSIMNGNCEPEKVIQYAVAKKFDCLKINKTHLLGRFHKHKNYLISDDKYDRIIKSFSQLKDKYPIDIELPREKYLNDKKSLPCSAGKKTIYINPDGLVFPCSFIPKEYLFGEFKNNSLENIISDNNSFSVNNEFCRKCPAMKKSHKITNKKII